MSTSSTCNKPVSGLTRRALLKSLLVSWTATCAMPWQPALAGTEPISDHQPDWLPLITGQREAVLRLGSLYLEAHAEEQDRERLLASVDQALAELQGDGAKSPENSSEVVSALKRIVRDEYIQDRVTPLQGWVVSLTEARLYALVAMFYSA